jgi:hypothetical protein
MLQILQTEENIDRDGSCVIRQAVDTSLMRRSFFDSRAQGLFRVGGISLFGVRETLR